MSHPFEHGPSPLDAEPGPDDGARGRAETDAVLAAIPDGVLVYDAEGRIVRANAAAERILGYTPAERAMSVRERLALEHVQWLTEDGRPVAWDEMPAVRAARDGETVTGVVLRMRRPDGERWLAVTAAPFVAGGIRTGAVVSLTDVTAHTRAERALRESEERYGVMFRRSPLAKFWARFPEGIIEDVSDAWVELTGISPEEAVGRSAAELALFDGAVRERFREALRGDGVAEVEAPLATRHRGRRTFFVRAEKVRFQGRSYLLGAMQDITDRRLAEEALRASEARFRSVFEQAAIGMGRVRFSDARWIDVNDAFCRMLGRSREELLRRPWPEITHPEDVEPDLVPFHRMAAGELDSYTVEKRFVHADGHLVWAKLTLSLVRDAAGRPDYEIAIIEDIGDRKRAEDALRASEERLRAANEQLRDADRRKDEFLGMLSHELRNPLAPIRNALFILDHAEPGGQQTRRAKEVASRQLVHMTRLVDDLLDVTRIARGKIELRRTDLDLAALAVRTAEDHRAVMQDRRLELEVHVPHEPVVVNGDETRLAQVLGNLLHNAAKFTPADGRVTLAVAAAGGHAEIRVRDTGSGIASDVLPTIFEPFTQARQTLARSEGGLGLGLALVRGLVALHGGEVAAYSPGPGQGTEFVVTLPLAAARETRRSDREPAPQRPRPHRVLVIDDNHDAAETLAELVGMLGHEARVAYDALDGLAQAADDPPDVVLCDIGLPGMDGYEFARQLRARPSQDHVRLVALSGYAQPEDVTRALDAGFDAHVAKPPDPDRLEGLLG